MGNLVEAPREIRVNILTVAAFHERHHYAFKGSEAEFD